MQAFIVTVSDLPVVLGKHCLLEVIYYYHHQLLNFCPFFQENSCALRYIDPIYGWAFPSLFSSVHWLIEDLLFSLLFLWFFLLSLACSSSVTMRLDMVFFILFAAHYTFYYYKLMVFAKLRNFVIISSKYCLLLLFLPLWLQLLSYKR